MPLDLEAELTHLKSVVQMLKSRVESLENWKAEHEKPPKPLIPQKNQLYRENANEL